jgi:uncharacterized protein
VRPGFFQNQYPSNRPDVALSFIWKLTQKWQEAVIHSIIEEKRAGLEALCRRYRVARLEVFGSAASGDAFDPLRSDADFLVEFQPASGLSPLEEFFGLKSALAALLERPVDLIEAKAIKNPFVLNSINLTRETVYAA